jgi:succinate dehydrogenase / fumarate reductase cytochrome b subunit
MSRHRQLTQTSIGKKAVMAVTGLILFGFVVGHMLGNLQVYMGPAKLNAYAKFLHETPSLLWGTRVLLLFSVILHIFAAASLASQQRRARPVNYAHGRTVQASYASRTMYWSGPIVLAFVVYHLLHFTTGHAHPNFVRGDVYQNFIVAFSDWRVSAAYIVAMIALGLHLMHGIWSLLQTLGINPTYRDSLQNLAVGAAGIVVVGNVSMPLAVLLGVVR